MARDGLFRTGMAICELGSEDMAAKGYDDLIGRLFSTMGVQRPSPEELRALSLGAARDFYVALGCSYRCIDTDARHEAITLDLNFDTVPIEHRGRYDLVTNIGTNEHVFADANAFRVAHDLAKTDGLIIHVLPFRGYLNHGFRNYQPDFFRFVARSNGYDFLGFWLSIHDTIGSLIPFEERLLEYLDFKPVANVALVALYRKPQDLPFNVPMQRGYEGSINDDASFRYRYVVDGELMNGKLVKEIVVTRRRHLFELPVPEMAKLTLREFVARGRRKMGI
jgi:hypothetical protein